MMNIRLVCFTAVLIHHLILSIDGKSRHGREIKLDGARSIKTQIKQQRTNELIKIMKNKDERSLEKSNFPHNRQKRGWGSIVYYASSIMIRTTNVGLTLAAVVSDGCVYYPSICEDRDAIEELDAEIQTLKTEYDEEYVKSAEDWVNLRDANNNNGYVHYYIDDAVQSVQTLSDLQLLLTDKLELKVPVLFETYNAQQNYSSEDYLEILVGQLEANFEATQKLLSAQKQSEMIGLLVQLLVETTLESFAKSYTNIYNDLRLWDKTVVELDALWTAVFEATPKEASILSDPSNPDFENALERNGLKFSEITAFEKVKMAPAVLSEMFKNSKIYAAETYNSLREWTQIDTWDGFKEKTYATLESPISKMKAVTEFVFNANSRKYTVENFELDWSSRIMYGLSALVDVITQAVSIAQWAEVRDKMAEARADYEEYVTDLRSELDTIREEQENQTAEWVNIIDTFKELSEAFDGLIQNASEYADFADVLGLPRLPVDTNNPLFSVDLSTLDKSNLISIQEPYISFLIDNNNDLTVLNDQMLARDTLYTSLLDRTEDEETVGEILTDLKSIYQFNPSYTVQDFGSNLTVKDIVCTTAVLRVDLDEYDFYDLPTFRPVCDVNDTTFDVMYEEAELLRNQGIMDTIIFYEIDGGSTDSLTELLGVVQNAYKVTDDDTLMTYGESLTVQDIACSIATQFPDMDMYDYIDLSAFRPSCDVVTTADFTTMQQDAERLRTLDTQIESSMDICDAFYFCPCISLLSGNYGATDDEVTASIKRVRPEQTEYCSTMGCACVTL